MAEPRSYMLHYTCLDNDDAKSCEEYWQDESESPSAWGYCPYCGKRRSAYLVYVAGAADGEPVEVVRGSYL